MFKDFEDAPSRSYPDQNVKELISMTSFLPRLLPTIVNLFSYVFAFTTMRKQKFKVSIPPKKNIKSFGFISLCLIFYFKVDNESTSTWISLSDQIIFSGHFSMSQINNIWPGNCTCVKQPTSIQWPLLQVQSVTAEWRYHYIIQSFIYRVWEILVSYWYLLSI